MPAGTTVTDAARRQGGGSSVTLIACALGAGALSVGIFGSGAGLVVGLACGASLGVWVNRHRRSS